MVNVKTKILTQDQLKIVINNPEFVGSNSSGGKNMHFPKGIDIYFDNVGGKMLDEVLLHMNAHGRIAVSGMISQYNLQKGDGLHNMFCLILNRLKMQGFVELDFKHEIYPVYLKWAMEKLKEKKLIFIEDIAQGLENAPSALVGIFHGRNVGKQLVCIAQE